MEQPQIPQTRQGAGMIVTHEWNWRMFCIGAVHYANLKCFEIYLGPLAIGIWWGVK
jgi:hypothetical protein